MAVSINYGYITKNEVLWNAFIYVYILDNFLNLRFYQRMLGYKLLDVSGIKQVLFYVAYVCSVLIGCKWLMVRTQSFQGKKLSNCGLTFFSPLQSLPWWYSTILYPLHIAFIFCVRCFFPKERTAVTDVRFWSGWVSKEADSEGSVWRLVKFMISLWGGIQGWYNLHS